MLTFDESVQTIVKDSSPDLPDEKIIDVQQAFKEDVCNNEYIKEWARFQAQLHGENYALTELHHALYSCYLNGVTLGVSIGVRMERVTE